ncbi:MAG: hypothetical protein N2487_05150 [Verrucomicrobiae bacterium]|nr:hypothetical protein [Verrucomicrobiae bacterium]
MNRFLRILTLLCAITIGHTAIAQIKVDLSFPQEQYLAYEPIIAVLKISNQSGQSIKFKNDDDWLDFSLQTKSGRIIPKATNIREQEDFELQSGEAATIRIDIQPFFKPTDPGKYAATATVKIKNWDKTFTTEQTMLDIVTGIKIWEKEFGVPVDNETKEAPDVRKYALLMANFKQNLRLYFRLSSADEGVIYKMTFLGNLTSISRPETNLDKFNNLHILHQFGAKMFKYTVISPDGKIFIRETHEYVNTRPRLWMDNDGKIFVRGGARKISSDDIPGFSKK